MKIINTILIALLLTSCTYRVQFGKACTPGNSEWSYVWLKEKGEVNISRENCTKKQKGNMKRKTLTITFKNCRDDIAKTFMIDTKQNIKKYISCNRTDFKKRKSDITIRGAIETQDYVTNE